MLGATSSTFDPEGTITEFVEAHGNAPEGVYSPYAPTRSDIERAFDKFRGGYEQKATLHSAEKIGGKSCPN